MSRKNQKSDGLIWADPRTVVRFQASNALWDRWDRMYLARDPGLVARRNAFLLAHEDREAAFELFLSIEENGRTP